MKIKKISAFLLILGLTNAPVSSQLATAENTPNNQTLLSSTNLKSGLILAQTSESTPSNNNNDVVPEVTLLDPGNEPRQLLRFNPKQPSEETGTMGMDMEISISMNDQLTQRMKVPTTEIDINFKVKEIDEDGNISVDFAYDNINVSQDETIEPSFREIMTSTYKQLEGITGSYVIDSRGVAKDININLETIEPSLKQSIEQVYNSIEQLSFPLPEEKVGIGGKWEVTAFVNINGVQIEQIATYEVVDIKDDLITLDISLSQVGDTTATTPPPGIPPESIENLAIESSGQGQMILRLDKLVPVSSNLKMFSSTNVQLAIPDSQEKMNIQTNATSTINIKSKD